MGGEEYLGLYIALFTITAGASRPFSGKLTDKIGRIPVMIFGALVCFIMGLLYPFVVTVFGFLALRFLHGFSTGFKPTGTTAYAADIVPVNRRGEAMGILGMAGNLGMASGPTIGSAIANNFSTDWMFYASSGFAIFSVIILIGMKETLAEKEKFKPSMLRIKKDEIIDWNVLSPSVVMVLTTFSYGIILTVIPDYSEYLGLENKGYFFTVFTISSLMVRVIAGRISDRFGRGTVARFGTMMFVIAMASIAFAESVTMLFTAGVLFGIATGMNTPILFAWTVDLADPKHRGRAMATVYIALEIGITLGSLISGWVYGSNPANFKMTFLLGSFAALFGFLFLAVRKKLNMP